MIKKMSVLVVLALMVLAGCGFEEGFNEPEEVSDSVEQTVELSIVGTIGVELGDSNYVLGAVQQIDFDLDGNILVLDRSACCVRMYTPQGEFIRQISNEGSGPGELLNPMSMTVVGDGRVFVESPFSGGMHAFATEGEWLGLVTPFFNNPPINTIGADSNSYVAMRIEVLPNSSGDVMVNSFIGRYEEGEDPVTKYWEYEFPFDPNDLTALLRNSLMGHVFTADRQGNVYVAELTSDFYLVQGFRADGELFLEIEKSVDKVEKSADEIYEEEIYVIAYLESLGANGVVLEYDAEPYRNSISEVEVDGEGRIWVRRGTELYPVFDVYNQEGEELFTASVPNAGDDAVFWEFNIDEQGIMAYSINPELFQQIYIMELSE